MNTNVGDMPIEIFGDYISDCLDMDFPWEYLAAITNDDAYYHNPDRRGCGTFYEMNGNGYAYNYTSETYSIGTGYGSSQDWMTSGNGDMGKDISLGNGMHHPASLNWTND